MSFLNLLKRRPDRYIGGELNPYMRRWYLWPRNRWANNYLNHIMRSDDDRALHNHPWCSVSIILSGGYREWTPEGSEVFTAGDVIFRGANYRHRIDLIHGRPAWTLFLTGPKVQNWGFFCPKCFVPWQQFVNPDNSDLTGAGCGEYDESVASIRQAIQKEWRGPPEDQGFVKTPEGFGDSLGDLLLRTAGVRSS